MAKLIYKILRCPHPFDAKRRAAGEEAYALFHQTVGEVAELWEEPIAVFNRDSEVEVFMAHLFEIDPNGVVIEIPKQYRELFESRRKARKRG